MVTQTAKKSKKSSQKTNKTCFILRRYEIKATGRVCCVVRNGENKEYTVCIDEHGHATCVQANGENCPSRRSGHTCYHIKHVLEQEAARKERQPRVVEPVAEVQFSLTMTESEMEAWGKQERRLWDEEMATWTEEQVPAPSPIEQAMPAPVVTIDQAMAEANNAMGGYDSCKICGFRIKCGRMFCARC